ncbi:MAG: hypothetical protein ACE5HT_03020 [Gemmatimonadales bacterium]
MDFSIVAMVTVQVTFVLGLAHVGSRIWMKKKELQKQADTADILRAIDDLQAEVDQLRSSQDIHVMELYERLDFAERMLTQGNQLTKREKPESTPV